LDELALQSVLLSNPVPALPKGLNNRELKVRLTFMFIGAKEPFLGRKQ
jgi:hypothetical protein